MTVPPTSCSLSATEPSCSSSAARSRGALLGLIAGSPADALLRAAHCPVMVVPAPGPPRTTWLPSDAHGRKLSHS